MCEMDVLAERLFVIGYWVDCQCRIHNNGGADTKKRVIVPETHKIIALLEAVVERLNDSLP